MAQGALYPFAKIQFLDNSGNPLAGGLLYTAAAGLPSTPLATYSDSALTVPNANPVVLDAAGRAAVYLLPQSYFITLKTSAGVTVWTQDNVYDIASLIVAGFAQFAVPSSTLAGLPAAGTAGRVSRVTNIYPGLYMDNGTTWVPVNSVMASTLAGLPAAGTTGRIARITDVKRGFWMDNGTNWFSVSGERPNLIEFAADRTGVADCSAAFRAAVTAQQSGYASSSVASEGESRANAAVFLPYGIYRLSASINNGVAMNGLRIIGDNAIVELDAGVVFCDSLRYFFYIHGVTIRGGLRHFDIKTGNAECMMVFENCEFMYPSSRVFNIDATSQSTQVLIKKCRIFTNTITASQVLVALSCDYVLFEDCFIKPGTTAASAIDVTNTKLYIIRMVGVPQMLHSWVTLRGQATSFYADPLCRFGGEDGGVQTSLIENYVEGYTFQEQLTNTIHLDGCEIYCAGSATVLNCYAIPNMVIIENCFGMPAVDPIKIQSSVTAAQLSRIGEMNSIFKVSHNALRYGTYINPAGSSVIAREGLPLVEDRLMLSGIPDAADLALQSGGNTASYTPVTASTSTTLATTTDQFAVPIRTMTATADNGLGSWYYTTALSGFAAGVYTAVFDIELTTSTACSVEFRASNTATRQQFAPSRGRHTICIPFYYDGVGATGYLPQSIAIDVLSMPNTAVLRWHRFRIYHGRRHITGPTVEVYGTAAPTTGLWFRGDKVLNTAKTRFGLPNFWMCQVTGSPGTWAADIKAGSFTMDAAASKVISEAEMKTDGSTWKSVVCLEADNNPAAVLQNGVNALYVSAQVDGTSFTVTTAAGGPAAGTELYRYVLLN